MTQHTPGPWSLTKHSLYGDYDLCITGIDGGPDGGWFLSLSMGNAAGDVDPEASRVEFEANVRLLTAAPDLLEMTRLLERSLIYEIKKSAAEDDEKGARLKTITLNLVRIAIAKALDTERERE